MIVTVLVPTYRRTADLERCLNALRLQVRVADEVLVVAREGDEETKAFLSGYDATGLPLQIVPVCAPGQVAALNAGLEAAQGDIIAITDDDAAPRPQWLQRIERHFLENLEVAGVGGRDVVYHSGKIEDGARREVGLVRWYGKLIGNHHLGVGEPREVDHLKGANMSYRRSAIAGLRFDTRLLGAGSQIRNDTSFSLALRSRGWKLVYDPEAAVDHHPAPRRDVDQRNTFNYQANVWIVHNDTVVVWEYLRPWQRPLFLAWAFLVGTRDAPGLVQTALHLLRRNRDGLSMARSHLVGRVAGLGTVLRHRRRISSTAEAVR